MLDELRRLAVTLVRTSGPFAFIGLTAQMRSAYCGSYLFHARVDDLEPFIKRRKQLRKLTFLKADPRAGQRWMIAPVPILNLELRRVGGQDVLSALRRVGPKEIAIPVDSGDHFVGVCVNERPATGLYD